MNSISISKKTMDFLMFEEATNVDGMISKEIGIQLEVFLEIRVQLERRPNPVGNRIGFLDYKIRIRSTG